MKNIIYWFSGTGNSFHVAKRIATEIDADLRPLSLFTAKELEKGQNVGIVCPVYAFGIPRMVMEALRNVPDDLGEYVFAVFTYTRQPGYAGYLLEKAIAKNNNYRSACYGLMMPPNYPPFGGAPDVDEQRKFFDSAEPQIDEIITQIQTKQTGHFEKNNPILRIMGRLLFPMFLKSLKKSDEKFFADEKCTSCGICERVCPAGNITLNGKPSWSGNCEQCFACFNWCPENAIQYGNKTTKQIRYHHPNVKLPEILKQTGK